MTTRAYLGQIERCECMIQNKTSEIERLKHLATSITVVPKEVNVQASSDKDRVGDTVAKLTDLEEEIKNLIDDYINKRRRIVEQIDSMKDTNMYHVLSARYISGKDLKKIAAEKGCSFRQVRRIHEEALVEFERIYGIEYKSL